MASTVNVAMSADFLKAFSKLHKKQQKDVREFLNKFQSNPLSPGINYETINAAKDPNLRSVRINKAYRCILLKPASGNEYLLLWVDSHDEAYNWARNHECKINPEMGAIQIYEVQHVDSMSPAQSAALVNANNVFVELQDRQLIKLGVPVDLLPVVRAVTNEMELDKIQARLPLEAYEGLFLFLAGDGFDEIIKERRPVKTAIDTGDFKAALERYETRSRIVVVDDEHELRKMLDAPLAQWRVFLHPSQRRLVNGVKNGAARVLGGAGTGKSVVAMHRAKWLAENISGVNQKILFTTFTKNLALDITENLKSICNSKQMAKLEITNFDNWVFRFLRQRQFDFNILYELDGGQLWQQALESKPADLDFHDSFYREEWLQIIQPNKIHTVEDYRDISRTGRGTRLSRAERSKIWRVFSNYRDILTANKCCEPDDAYNQAASILEKETCKPFGAIIIDEAQDLSAAAFRLLRAMAQEGENDLFIVGDGHQRIYSKQKVVLSQSGINIRGRSRTLRINYRTTEEIRNWAVNLLDDIDVDDLDGGIDSNVIYKSLISGEDPIVTAFSTKIEQEDYLANYLTASTITPLSSICVVARTNNEIDQLTNCLRKRGIKFSKITRKSSNNGPDDAVRAATMHRVKGLEFEEVILVSMNEGLVPSIRAQESTHDKDERQQIELQERALVYVAATRAKRNLKILSYGKPSSYI